MNWRSELLTNVKILNSGNDYSITFVYLSCQTTQNTTTMKKQINKAQVLRKAWNDFRSMGGNTMAIFADCLRNAWSYYKEAAAMGAQGAQFYIQNVKEQILEVNYRRTRGVAHDGLAFVRSVRDAACGFASDVAATVAKYGKCSEKQAYVIARACYDLGI